MSNTTFGDDLWRILIPSTRDVVISRALSLLEELNAPAKMRFREKRFGQLDKQTHGRVLLLRQRGVHPTRDGVVPSLICSDSQKFEGHYVLRLYEQVRRLLFFFAVGT